MPGDVFVLGGHQTDFARNYSRENKDIAALMDDAVEGALRYLPDRSARDRNRACRQLCRRTVLQSGRPRRPVRGAAAGIQRSAVGPSLRPPAHRAALRCLAPQP